MQRFVFGVIFPSHIEEVENEKMHSPIMGFNNWKEALEKFVEHIGAINSAHNDAIVQFQSIQNQR